MNFKVSFYKDGSAYQVEHSLELQANDIDAALEEGKKQRPKNVDKINISVQELKTNENENTSVRHSN